MANTAPMPHAPVSREIAPGVTVSNQMTPTQILEAHVKANVQPYQGGVGHTDGTVARMNYGDGAQKAVVPVAKPAAPAFTPPAAKPGQTPQEAFAEEVREKGLTVEPTTQEQTENDIALVTARYSALMQSGGSMLEEQRLRFK